MNPCLCCGTDTKNPKFCSQSCAAKVNNVLFPKKSGKKCNICGDRVAHYRTVFCPEHLEDHKTSKALKNLPLSSYRERVSVKGKHPSWVSAHIRLFNRSWNKDLTKEPCRKCGYSLHIELCHLRPIRDFPDTALLSEVNARDNVVPLCRNCHWELDNGYYSIPAPVITTALSN